jgi:hypothetical protein
VKAVLGSAWRASFFLLDDVDMAVREKAAELARGLVSLPPLRNLSFYTRKLMFEEHVFMCASTFSKRDTI